MQVATQIKATPSNTIDARIIANEVIDRANAKGRAITNLDLQKLVYFVHGHFLCRHQRPLVQEEFEAWPYGPVHRIVYDAFRQYNDTPIEGHAMAFNPVTRTYRPLPPLRDAEAATLMDEVLDRYLKLSTFSLVDLTHRPGTPWSMTIEAAESKVNLGMRIPNETILEFFEGAAL